MGSKAERPDSVAPQERTVLCLLVLWAGRLERWQNGEITCLGQKGIKEDGKASEASELGLTRVWKRDPMEDTPRMSGVRFCPWAGAGAL